MLFKVHGPQKIISPQPESKLPLRVPTRSTEVLSNVCLVAELYERMIPFLVCRPSLPCQRTQLLTHIVLEDVCSVLSYTKTHCSLPKYCFTSIISLGYLLPTCLCSSRWVAALAFLSGEVLVKIVVAVGAEGGEKW